MNYQLDQDLMDEDYQTTNAASVDYEQLPFAAPIIYWKHGSKTAKPKSTSYYGRWNSDQDGYDQVAQELNIAVPQSVETRINDKGEQYHIYAWRAIIFAPIASRFRWYFDKKRNKNISHIQVLVHLAERKEGTLVATMPAVLSAKVYASDDLKKCIKDWFAFVENLQPAIPPHYFYMAAGTFGDTQEFVGSHKNETKPTLYLPKDATAESLPFVGNEIARKIKALKAEAQPWLNDENWLKPGNETETSEQSATEYQPTKPAQDIPF